MIGTIGSLVQETSSRLHWLLATSLYTLACLCTATLLGLALGALGSFLRGVVHATGLHAPFAQFGAALVGVLALAYAASDLGFFALPRPILMPAVPLAWWRRWRPYGAAVAYGAALGFGVMTRVWFGAFYVVCAWALVQGDPRYGALLLGMYGLVRALTMFPASYGLACHREDVVGWLSSPLFDLARARRIAAAASIVFAVVILMAATAALTPR